MSSSIPHYRVSIWEGLAIAAGAVLIVGVGLVGLGVKALNNAFDSQRAEAIALSMAEFSIAGGSKGLFGTNVGGGKMAVIGSESALRLSADPATGLTSLPEVELLIARIPTQPDAETQTEGKSAVQSDPEAWSTDLFFSGFSFSNQTADSFKVATARTESLVFCGASVPVTIREGTLGNPDQPAVSAIRYEAKTSLNAEDYIVIISAVGQRAPESARQVFYSIRCKE